MITPSYKWHLKQYCKEYWKIKNYDLAFKDDFKGWNCHHIWELTINGEYAHNQEELIRLGMYYDRPYFELEFVRVKEHNDMHGKLWKKGKKISEEERKKMGDAHMGKPATWNMHPKSEETKRKLSESHKGKPLSETTKKNMSISQKKREIKSEFGKKFFEHYGLKQYQNLKLYQTEWAWWKRNGKCRWE